jgi:hypothetical protein
VSASTPNRGNPDPSIFIRTYEQTRETVTRPDVQQPASLCTRIGRKKTHVRHHGEVKARGTRHATYHMVHTIHGLIVRPAFYLDRSRSRVDVWVDLSGWSGGVALLSSRPYSNGVIESHISQLYRPPVISVIHVRAGACMNRDLRMSIYYSLSNRCPPLCTGLKAGSKAGSKAGEGLRMSVLIYASCRGSESIPVDE